jgi:hypothetical protein
MKNMKKSKSTIVYDIETYTYRDSYDKQISLLYKLANDLNRKRLNKQRKLKLTKINNLNNES